MKEKSVLILEDNAAKAEVLVAQFSGSGYRVLLQSDCRECTKYGVSPAPSVIVAEIGILYRRNPVNVELPPSFAKTPLFLLCSHKDPATCMQAYRYEAFGIATWDTKEPDIPAKIEKVLRQPNSVRGREAGHRN